MSFQASFFKLNEGRIRSIEFSDGEEIEIGKRHIVVGKEFDFNDPSAVLPDDKIKIAGRPATPAKGVLQIGDEVHGVAYRLGDVKRVTLDDSQTSTEAGDNGCKSD
jgi:hypothetical protein